MMGFPEYDIIETLNWTVNCESTEITRFSFDTTGRLIVTSKVNDSTTFVLMYSFEALGASQESDMVDQAKLMFTTLSFE